MKLKCCSSNLFWDSGTRILLFRLQCNVHCKITWLLVKPTAILNLVKSWPCIFYFSPKNSIALVLSYILWYESFTKSCILIITLQNSIKRSIFRPANFFTYLIVESRLFILCNFLLFLYHLLKYAKQYRIIDFWINVWVNIVFDMASKDVEVFKVYLSNYINRLDQCTIQKQWN